MIKNINNKSSREHYIVFKKNYMKELAKVISANEKMDTTLFVFIKPHYREIK